MPDKERKKKPKKEKIVYVDDGSTVFDMSGLDETRKFRKRKNPDERQRPKVFEHLKTYFSSVKVMLLPMIVVMGLVAAAFFLMWILMGGLQSLF